MDGAENELVAGAFKVGALFERDAERGVILETIGELMVFAKDREFIVWLRKDEKRKDLDMRGNYSSGGKFRSLGQGRLSGFKTDHSRFGFRNSGVDGSGDPVEELFTHLRDVFGFGDRLDFPFRPHGPDEGGHFLKYVFFWASGM